MGDAEQLGSRYLLHEVIGRGAMGQVHRGTARDTGEPVAIKVLRPELVSDPDAVARFMQERQILTSIDSPAAVRVIDLVAEGETLAIVMELVDGQDLRRRLRSAKTLPPAEAAGLAVQLLTGLGAVHAAGVVHRDVKPENLLLDTAAGPATLKVTDFGVARLSYGGSLTKLSSLIGTPEYMAPELADGDSADPAADVYSAGVVLYEMLSGRTPFAGGSPVAVLRRHADMAPPEVPGLPGALWEQLSLMLAKEPADRPAAAEAADALDALATALAPLPALPPMDEPASYQRVAGAPGLEAGGGATSTVVRVRDRGAPAAAPGLTGASQDAPPVSARAAAWWRRPAPIAGAVAVVAAAAVAVAVLPSALQHHLTPSPTGAASSPVADQGVNGAQAVAAGQFSGSPTPSATATGAATPLSGRQPAAVQSQTAADPTAAPQGGGGGLPVAVPPDPASPSASVESPVSPAPPATSAPAAPAKTSAPAAPPAAAYAVTTLSTGSSSVTATAYFGQFSAVTSVAGVTFNSSNVQPGLCVETVVFRQVSNATGTVYAEGLGSGWTGAEGVPSQDTQGGTLHQQLVVPPGSVSAGASFSASAKLIAGSLQVSSGSFPLTLRSASGAAQTWLVNGQAVSCDS